MLSKLARALGWLTVVALGLAFGVALAGWMLRGEIRTTPIVRSDAEISRVESLRHFRFDAGNPPTAHATVDYAEGAEAAWYPRAEAPVLGALVKEGWLPPLSERVGPEPLVLRGPDGIGNYGGTWVRAVTSPTDFDAIVHRMFMVNLVAWSPMGHPIRPHLARSWEVSEDKRVWTFHLRRGLRWSDGHPCNASDIMYWWEKEYPFLYHSPPPFMVVAGQPGRIEMLDEHTVRFVFPQSFSAFPELLASNTKIMISPRHYLERYMPGVGDENTIREAMTAGGYKSPRAFYRALQNLKNPYHPRLWPWIYTTFKRNPPESMVRNPYFWAVDPEGNQLPYVDRILFESKSLKVVPLAAASGELTMEDRYLTVENYILLMENRDRYGYEIHHWYPGSRSIWAIWPNTNRIVPAGDKVAGMKASLLQDKRFRQALSLATDRKRIVDAVYSGWGEPAQIDPGPESSFAHEALRRSFTQYDPVRAGMLLDELGLVSRDSEDMRRFPDGSRMLWFLNYSERTGDGPAELVAQDWAKVGIRLVPRARARSLFSAEKGALLHDFTVWPGESEFNPLVYPTSFVATQVGSLFAPGTGMWYSSGGLHAADPETIQGVPARAGSELRRAQELLEQALQSPDGVRQHALVSEILDLAAEQVWSISIATPPPELVVVKNGFRNVPRCALVGYAFLSPNNARPELFYFERPEETAAARAQIATQVMTITPPGRGPDLSRVSRQDNSAASVAVWCFAALAGGLVLSAAIRYPTIGRRLVWMVPTLGTISVAVFCCVQLPPGDYVETKIQEYEATGERGEVEDAKRMREEFHLDAPLWEQYVRWMGLRWFFTFRDEDRGLLQGSLGISMATQRPVSDVVGDRIVLTVVVSAATILLTWVLALPIGIFTAVRPATPASHLLTLAGYVGMSAPGFLLALILMHLSSRLLGLNVTGLFSPAYSGTPEWSWGKVVDLLQHVWVPVLVIAVGGTASMIRVMRANLMDELRKPYVTTARAKGLRPVRLLLKYPVRLALNPFVSGLGTLFPQLVSGGAIVAIVLSLPLVGPLLLDALFLEDVYLAASMLMVLSVLGALGTLASDVLLLVLDPRIRLSATSR